MQKLHLNHRSQQRWRKVIHCIKEIRACRSCKAIQVAYRRLAYDIEWNVGNKNQFSFSGIGREVSCRRMCVPFYRATNLILRAWIELFRLGVCRRSVNFPILWTCVPNFLSVAIMHRVPGVQRITKYVQVYKMILVNWIFLMVSWILSYCNFSAYFIFEFIRLFTH